MRRRLIQSTLAVVLVVIAVFGVSLVLVEARTIENSAKESVDSEAVRLIGIVESRMIGEERISREVLAQQIAPGRYALVQIPGADPITIGTRPTGQVISSRQTGEQGETVTVEESRSKVSQEIGRTLLIILAVALLAVLAAVVLAVRQARRLGSPLTDLAVRDAAVRRSLARVEREPDLVPTGWTLHSVRAQTVEFWQGDKQRNHTRLNYRATATGWDRELLWP